MESPHNRGGNAPTRYLTLPRKTLCVMDRLHLVESSVKWASKMPAPCPLHKKENQRKLWRSPSTMVEPYSWDITYLLSSNKEKLNWYPTKTASLLTSIHGVGRYYTCYWKRNTIINTTSYKLFDLQKNLPIRCISARATVACTLWE